MSANNMLCDTLGEHVRAPWLGQRQWQQRQWLHHLTALIQQGHVKRLSLKRSRRRARRPRTRDAHHGHLAKQLAPPCLAVGLQLRAGEGVCAEDATSMVLDHHACTRQLACSVSVQRVHSLVPELLPFREARGSCQHVPELLHGLCLGRLGLTAVERVWQQPLVDALE